MINKQYTLGIRDEIQPTDRVWDYCQASKGWEDIIRRLLLDLDKPEMVWSNHITQVKEKFGTLRFYIGSATDPVFKRIAQAEKESAVTCQVCGNPGKLRPDGWWETLCDEHAGGRETENEDTIKPISLVFYAPVAEAGIGTSPTN